MDQELVNKITFKDTWIRLAFMVLFMVVQYFARLIVWLIALAQFVFTLLTGKHNTHLLSFGHSLGEYIFQIVEFLTYNSETKPYPFSPWVGEKKEKK